MIRGLPQRMRSCVSYRQKCVNVEEYKMFENDTTHALRANFVENWKVIRCHSNNYFFIKYLVEKF